MIGTILNVVGILLGGLVGLSRPRPLLANTESFFRVTLAAFTVFYGLQLTWRGLGGSFREAARQLAITVLAMILGRLLGKFLQLQEFSNQLGQYARAQVEDARPDSPELVGRGFRAATALYCAAPLGILGALYDGLSGYFFPLAVKGVMEGLATMGFVRVFGPGVLVAAIPVLAFQGTITLVSNQLLLPFLEVHGLVNSLNATGGLLIFSVALVMLELKRIALADYLPSLALAPLLAWLWR